MEKVETPESFYDYVSALNGVLNGWHVTLV